ncbi:MAG: TonB family protein [Paludibacter sp.]|nr:TonB family protein [Paludibacter sp.]
MSLTTDFKNLFLLISCLITISAIYGQEDIKKVRASDVHEGYKYYLHDSLICSSEYDTICKREVFRKVTEWPVFGDSITDFFKYIHLNLKYQDFYSSINARVIVQFIVETDGTLTNFKILRSLDATLDKQAIKILKNMPNWSSGKCNGEKVPTYFVVPIKF